MIEISKRPETCLGLNVYVTNTSCKIFCGIENGIWHLSISHKFREPTWEEIKTARYKLIPDDIQVVMYLPPPEQYVNIHPFCFHLWELKESTDKEKLIDFYKENLKPSTDK